VKKNNLTLNTRLLADRPACLAGRLLLEGEALLNLRRMLPFSFEEKGSGDEVR
jgi:hypothetical protein